MWLYWVLTAGALLVSLNVLFVVAMEFQARREDRDEAHDTGEAQGAVPSGARRA